MDLLYLRGKEVYISYDYLVNDEKLSDKINIYVPFDVIDVKNFIISQINIKLSEFVELKNNIFVKNIETKENFVGNLDLDYRQYLL